MRCPQSWWRVRPAMCVRHELAWSFVELECVAMSISTFFHVLSMFIAFAFTVGTGITAAAVDGGRDHAARRCGLRIRDGGVERVLSRVDVARRRLRLRRTALDRRNRGDGDETLTERLDLASVANRPAPLAFELQLVDPLHRKVEEQIGIAEGSFFAAIHIFTPHPPNSVLSAPRGRWTSSVRVRPRTSCSCAVDRAIVRSIRTIGILGCLHLTVVTYQ